MASFMYNAAKSAFASGLDWSDVAASFRVLLEEDASTYSPNPDHEFLDEATGLVEVTAGGYARQDVDNRTVTTNTTNDRAELDADDIEFGAISATGSQIAKGVILYLEVGGDDTTPENDLLIAYIDDADTQGLPVTFNGGNVTLTVAAGGLLQLT